MRRSLRVERGAATIGRLPCVRAPCASSDTFSGAHAAGRPTRVSVWSSALSLAVPHSAPNLPESVVGQIVSLKSFRKKFETIPTIRDAGGWCAPGPAPAKQRDTGFSIHPAGAPDCPLSRTLSAPLATAGPAAARSARRTVRSVCPRTSDLDRSSRAAVTSGTLVVSRFVIANALTHGSVVPRGLSH